MEESAQQLYRDLASAAESGWDFSSRWLADSQNLATIRTTKIVPVDLNTFLWNLEQVLSKLMAASGDADGAQQVSATFLPHVDVIGLQDEGSPGATVAWNPAFMKDMRVWLACSC